MARIVVQGEGVVIVLSWWEVPFVGRRRIELKCGEVAEVKAVARPMRMKRGPRAGFWITGLARMGLFGTVRCCLTSVRRGRPALYLILRNGGGGAFHEILVSDVRVDEHVQALGGAQ